jgi:hypothetical protein
MDAMQEFKMELSGYSAEIGRDGPGVAHVNASMMKNFRIEERRKHAGAHRRVQCAEPHENFLLPNNQFNGSTAGLISGVGVAGGRGGAQVFQAGLKLEFYLDRRPLKKRGQSRTSAAPIQ